ncbi:flippase [Candidatus Parcubacteria bacterium]|nr:flippase [Candidatus Parcubacteria bacterium]
MSKIAKNTSYFTFALILQKVISFSYFAILASKLDPGNLGAYYTAISLVAIFSIFVDLGLTNVLTREVAKNREVAGKMLGAVMAIKIPLAIIFSLFLIIAVNVLGYSELTKNLVYILLVTMALDPFVSSFFAVSRGFQNLVFESVAVVVYQLIVLSFGLTALKFQLPLEVLAIGLSVATLFNFSYSLLLLKFKWRISLKPIYDKILLKHTIYITIPFALFAILQRLYMYLDSVLLSVLAGEEYVGLYQIAFKIIFALQFLPMAFVASLYPAFSRYWKEDKSKLEISFVRAINYLIIISIPISAGVIVLADKILVIFKPEYIEALNSLRLIMFALPFVFINFPIGSLLNACDKQKINTRNMAIALSLAIILNLILIPEFQTLGAAITVLITNIIMFILGISSIFNIIKYKINKNLIVFIKSFFSVLLMASFVYYFKDFINIFIIVPLAGIIYFVALLTVKGIQINDIKSVLNSFK